jgi:hypothetical protein
MGMRINGTGSSVAAQNSGVNTWQQRRQDFQSLFSALQSGDLASAQKAGAAIEASRGNSKEASNPNSPISQLLQDLKSGDLAGAQKIADQIQAARAQRQRHSEPTPVKRTVMPELTPPGSNGSDGSNGTKVNLVA